MRTTETKYFDGQMDDFKVFNYEILEPQIEEIGNPRIKILSLITISGTTLTTPAAPDSGGLTEGTIRLKALVETIGASNLYDDPSRAITIADTGDFTFDTPTMFGTETLDNNKNTLTVEIPYLSTGVIAAGTINPVTVAVETSSSIVDTGTGVTTHLPSFAKSTANDARANGWRVAMWVHSIGGSSGQAEERGNVYGDTRGNT